MRLDEVVIDRSEAREQYARYLEVAKQSKDTRARRELQQLADAYRVAARNDISLIALTPTIARGGTQVRQLRSDRWRDGKNTVVTKSYLLPNLAVCRASERFCFTLGVRESGAVQYGDRLRFAWNYSSGMLDIEAGFTLPDGFEAGTRLNSWNSAAWSAQVPIVPPAAREHAGLRSNTNLRGYLILWEVDEWTWRTDPAPSRDPALLRHVAGDVYAVVATWDLTDLERLVLSGRTITAEDTGR